MFSLSFGPRLALLVVSGLAAGCNATLTPITRPVAPVTATTAAALATSSIQAAPNAAPASGPEASPSPTATTDLSSLELDSEEHAFLVASISQSASKIIQTVGRIQEWVAPDSINHQSTAACGYIGMLNQQALEVARNVRQLDVNLVGPPAQDVTANYLRVDLDHASRFTNQLFDACNGNDRHFTWGNAGLFPSLAQRGPISIYLEVGFWQYRRSRLPMMRRLINQVSFAYSELTHTPGIDFLALSPE